MNKLLDFYLYYAIFGLVFENFGDRFIVANVVSRNIFDALSEGMYTWITINQHTISCVANFLWINTMFTFES